MSIFTTALRQIQGHLIVGLDGRQWLIDTGAPASFGTGGDLPLCGQQYEIPSNYMGFDQSELSGLIHHPVDGLLGADILNELDWILNLGEGTLSVSAAPMQLVGTVVAIASFVMGVPIVEIVAAGETEAVFFDTGAPISYLVNTDLSVYPDCGVQKDFYPGFGEFKKQTHRVPLQVGRLSMELVCGALPDILGMTLGLAGTSGILGNEPMKTERSATSRGGRRSCLHGCAPRLVGGGLRRGL